MTALGSLLLPILLAAVVVFVVSSIIHMATPWHKNDFQPMPNEGSVMDAMRPFAIPPGDYMIPRAGSMADLKSAEFADKLNKGPVAVMTVYPNGPFSMTSNLVQWFLYSVVINIFAAYVAGHALGPGAEYLSVFRFVGTAAFLGYAAGLWQFSIWYKKSWATTFRSTVDGFVYALVTAGTFGWLWPQ